MRTLIETVAGLAILANAVIYGTDVFGAIVQRLAIAAVDDRSLTQVARPRPPRRGSPLRGDRHQRPVRRRGDGRARGHEWAVGEHRGRRARHLALIVFSGIYARISKPVNTALTAAAAADRVPDDARQLQVRWDSVIEGRVALQTVALAALCVALAAA